jgi:hypothetical protein
VKNQEKWDWLKIAAWFLLIVISLAAIWAFLKLAFWIIFKVLGY